MHQGGDFRERRKNLFDIRPASQPEELLERRMDVGHGAAPDKRARYMRATKGRARSFGDHILLGDVDSPGTEVLDHLECPLVAALSGLFKERLDRGIRGLQEISQKVHLSPRDPHRELTPSNDTNAEPLPGGNSLGKSSERVVIGEGHCGEPGIMGPLDDVCRVEDPVRRRGMDVQVGAGCGQRPYPSSGEVAACWERARSVTRSRSVSRAKASSGLL